MDYTITVQFLMAYPDRWVDVDDFRDSSDALKFIEERQQYTNLNYRAIRHDGVVVMEAPAKKLQQ